MAESEIVEGLWVGDFQDGSRLLAEGWPTLCVLEARPDPAPDALMWIPVLRTFGVPPYIQAIPGQLDAAAAVIQHHQHLWKALSAMPVHSPAHPLIVHCGAGVERSPLTVAWWLVKHFKLSWDDAYELLKAKRPQVMDRREWLPAGVV